MALTHGAVSSDRVDHGSAAGIDDQDPFTVLIWCLPTTFTSNHFFWSKGDRSLFYFQQAGNIQTQVNRATTTHNYRTDDTPITIDAWNFVAWTFDSGASAGQMSNIYVGSLTAAATESTYSVSTDGTGSVDADAADPLLLGNRSTNPNLVFEGDIAIGAYSSVVLTAAQIVDWQFRPRTLANMLIFSDYHGTGTQPDLTGNGNAGTVTGATVAGHVPLGPPFGFDLQREGITAVAAAVGHDYLAATIRRRRVALVPEML